jgi:hypothetical protein
MKGLSLFNYFAERQRDARLNSVEARVFGGCLVVGLAALFACGNRSNEPAPSSEPDEEIAEAPIAPPEPKETPVVAPAAAAPTRVVLVTLDGVRWEDMLGATPETSSLVMPNLHRLVKERGVAYGGAGCEHDVRASGPNFVSLPGYIEIFTGKPPVCQHNHCPNIDTETIVDEVRATSHREADVAVFASWNRYSAAVAKDRKSIVLSAGARTIAIAAAKEDEKLKGFLVDGAANAGYPGHGDYRKDETTAKVALRYLETKTPRLLVMGLGDADEHAHRGDIAGYRKAIARADDILGELDKTLARMGDDGERTAVIVTTDHGRAKNLFNHGAIAPESARVFVAAFGASITHQGVTCAPEPMKLAHIAGTIRQLLGIEPDAKGQDANPLADAMLTSPDPAARNVR